MLREGGRGGPDIVRWSSTFFFSWVATCRVATRVHRALSFSLSLFLRAPGKNDGEYANEPCRDGGAVISVFRDCPGDGVNRHVVYLQVELNFSFVVVDG